MDRTAFPSLLSKRLHPVPKAEGFTGSGTILRSIAGALVHAFDVQGSASGGCFCLNLGAHLLRCARTWNGCLNPLTDTSAHPARGIE